MSLPGSAAGGYYVSGVFNSCRFDVRNAALAARMMPYLSITLPPVLSFCQFAGPACSCTFIPGVFVLSSSHLAALAHTILPFSRTRGCMTHCAHACVPHARRWISRRPHSRPPTGLRRFWSRRLKALLRWTIARGRQERRRGATRAEMTNPWTSNDGIEAIATLGLSCYT